MGDNNVISTNNPYSSNKSPNPENIRSSDSSIASNLTPGDKETLQSDSFHSEEKPVLLKSNVVEQSSAQNVVNMNMKSTSGGSPPKSLMTPSVSGPRNGGISHGGTSQHQNQRKVSTSSSVTSSPKRARIMNVNNNAAAHAGGTGKASTAALQRNPPISKTKHGYPRGGYYRHGGGGQHSQMSTADVNRRQR